MTLHDPFSFLWMGFNYLKAAGPLLGDSLFIQLRFFQSVNAYRFKCACQPATWSRLLSEGLNEGFLMYVFAMWVWCNNMMGIKLLIGEIDNFWKHCNIQDGALCDNS